MLYLSKGGRLTLIKSTLSNLPTYFMSLFPISTGVANRIEKLQCDFLWGGLDKEFKYYLRWSIVCTLISEGGLTVRNLLRFDHVLLGKWLWCYGLERKAWCTKYGSSWRDWCCWKPIEVYGVGLWKNIMSGWGKFSSHTRFEVGDGSKVRFWYDLWCGDMALEEAFPGLFGITCAKDAFVGISWKFWMFQEQLMIWR
jgi:hypothetical protein